MSGHKAWFCPGLQDSTEHLRGKYSSRYQTTGGFPTPPPVSMNPPGTTQDSNTSYKSVKLQCFWQIIGQTRQHKPRCQ